ncbi:hypothetical protein WICMUC_000682 [Wickerhamomyces mucosus]|uniref:rRNA-processing protein EFG1 n=1 Tax=Wickerhamomyces mucosus TaxID=1378264 RepID=A0A9P8TID6_9ASCO|nr:hypothetical protein WICMUC_000682 [Wickerhamomyces mucosus]
MAPIKTNRKQNNNSDGDSLNVIGSGSSKINKKIRDIERLLSKKRDQLPSDILVEKERQLAALKTELNNLSEVQKVKKIAKKYHMVRFFEKKKALRKYKQIKKEYDQLIVDVADKKDLKKLRKKLTHHEIDLAYVVNFPKDQKYIALYPTEDNNLPSNDPNKKKGLQKTENEKNAFKKQIEKWLKDDQLPVSIEDILSGKSYEHKIIRKIPSNVPDAPVSNKGKQGDGEEKEGEEEDEFFE